MSISRIQFRRPRANHSSHLVQRLVLPASGSKPVGALEKILLVDGIQQVHHYLLHDLILQGGNRDGSLLPVFLGDRDSAERLDLILPILEPLMKPADVSARVLLVLFVRDAVYPGASRLS